MSTIDSHSLEKQLTKSGSGIPDRIIKGDAADFRDKFNNEPFSFTHNLGEHPLFEMPRLVELAQTILKSERDVTRKPPFQPDELIPFGGVCCMTSKVPVHLKWNDMGTKDKLLEHLANIEKSDSWLLLYSVQRDPEYKALLHQIVAELEEHTGVSLEQELTSLDAYIFVASPRSITPYHIDHDSTFLFQIHGEREANLFNQSDRSVLTEQEIENFYFGDLSAANYKEENQKKAYVFPLMAGRGVHHPVCAPHWYKNGDSYSVALGIHLGLRSFDSKARVYQTNYLLRKLGFKPTPPSKSTFKDKVKSMTVGLFSKRTPTTKLDFFYSGISRIKFLVGLPKRVLRKLKPQVLKP